MTREPPAARSAVPARCLIVNADDLGASRGRDDAILALFAHGVVTSASLLVNGPSAAQAATRAVAADLPLGLHLNLSEGLPVADRGADGAASSSLVDAAGQLLGRFGLRAALADGRIAAADLAREIRAQFERFIALTGELPSHVTSHEHVHVEPAVASVLAPIMAREYGVYGVRLPIEAGIGESRAGEPLAAFHAAVSAAAAAARPIYARQGIYAPDAFIGQAFMGHRLQAAAVAAALDAVEQRGQQAAAAATAPPPTCLWVELMVHPGNAADADDDNAFGRSPERAHEAAVLASAAWTAATTHWQRASFRDFPRPRSPHGRVDTPPPRSRANVLVYGKLTPATGNAESARRLELAWSPLANVRFRPLVADPASPAAVAREARRLREFAAREQLDLVFGIHVHRAGMPLAAAFAPPASNATGIATAGDRSPPSRIAVPYGLLASGTDANADVQDPAKRAAMAGALAGADFLLCLTDDLRQRLQELPLPADTTVRPNGIDVGTASPYSLRTALGLAPEQRLVLFPATLRQVKGVLPLLQALGDALATHHPDHVLVILGPPLEAAYATAVRATMADLQGRHPNLHRRLFHLDGLPHDDYLAALREAALVLNASVHEGLCHGLMEAMAAGVPVLASDIPGNRQLIRDDENGRLFASFAELPTRYAACFGEVEATARMAAIAREEVARRFSASAEREALRAALERSLARHRRGARA